MNVVIIVNGLLAVLLIFLFLQFKKQKSNELLSVGLLLENLQKKLEKIESSFKEDFRINREENNRIATDNRHELNSTLKDFKSELGVVLKSMTDLQSISLNTINKTLEYKIDVLVSKIDENNRHSREELKATLQTFQLSFERSVESFNVLQKEKFNLLETKQNNLINHTEAKLDLIKNVVEEKLEKTLSERLGQSFETVGKHLIAVQKGLGEMQILAQDVGGLKKILGNVKMRGGIGEVQLAMLLEQVLAPDQYEANVKTKADSNHLVEFAIKLPGRSETQGNIWLPIDAKFPKDVFEYLQDAYDRGDIAEIELAQKNLESAVKTSAKDIRDKYLDPSRTTDFGIMFLPFEGLYAEVVRKASLLEELHRTYKIIVTGPTTLAAILNSLQMGFKTLAIEKRSGEVWQVLGAVKKEFENFGGLLNKAQSNIQTGLNQLDDVMGKRTRAIQRKLRGVETLSIDNAKLPMMELTEGSSSSIEDDI